MALFEAIEAGNAAEVRSILAENPSLASSRGPGGVSAILWARYRSRSEEVEALLAAGAVLDVFDAAALGRLGRLTELVDADPGQANAWSSDGFTPVGLAAFFGHPEAVRFLIGRGADVGAVARNPMRVQPLHAATAARDPESVRLILEAGADPDAEQQEGWTALMAARRHGDDEIIDLLLAHGANDKHPAPTPGTATADPAGGTQHEGGDAGGQAGGQAGGETGGQAGGEAGGETGGQAGGQAGGTSGSLSSTS